MLNDTLNLVQLARETARVQGHQQQAERMTPVVDGLRTLVTEARDAKSAVPAGGVLAQDDFKSLLAAVQAQPKTDSSSFFSSQPTDRSQIVQAMASGGMADVDIARQMGMTRDEVRLVLSIGQRTSGYQEVIK
jgi:hypothetical protein